VRQRVHVRACIAFTSSAGAMWARSRLVVASDECPSCAWMAFMGWDAARNGFTAVPAWVQVLGGLAIVVLLLVGNWFVGRQIAEPRLADAITGALREVTGDLRLTGLWIAAYGVVLFMAGVGYSLLQRAIVARNGRISALAVALGSDLKGNLSIAIYAASIPLAFLQPWISIALYVLVALMWLVPDRRIESAVK